MSNPTPATCKTCVHWVPMKAGVRSADEVGTCHASHPRGDFAWPRTTAKDHCALHKSATTLDAGTPGDAPPKEITPGGRGNPLEPRRAQRAARA